MDIANYLSELLGRYTEVSVPGLGCFSRLRVNGYYDDVQATFYPPGHKLNFDQQEKDDEILTRHIAEKKKISLASSKYFTEKYINSLKQELALHEVSFAQLGWFYMQEGKIAFRPQEQAPGNDPLFFGLNPVAINKVNYVAPPPPPPPLPTAFSLQQTYTPPPVATTIVEQPEYIDDDPEVKRGVSIWIIIAIAVVVLAGAAFGVYKYNPALLHLNDSSTEEQPRLEKPKATPAVKPDTIKKDSIPTVTDTAKAISKPVAALNKTVVNEDTISKTHYEILGGAFKTVKEANRTIANYEKMGLSAHILQNVPGRLIKVTLGSFYDRDEAVAAKQKIVSTGKLTSDKITIQPYNPKK
jgi:cell division septation protein DedD